VRPRALPEAWNAAYTKAKAAMGRISQNDKINIVSGIGWDKGPCVGNTAPVGSIQYPQLCLQDGPLGIRFGTGATAFTPGIQAAATWDVDLIRQRAAFMGAEAKAAGIHVLLGPVAGALGKHPQGGRNWEGFGPDPYLTGIAMIESVEGIQSAGVQACAKHYIVNEQERNRETMSSNVDDRTMHELYLWPFADAVKANVASVMCSYNKINGTWACESNSVMNNLLKKELGFPGYVVSDWNAQHTTQGSANGGMDMTMPGTNFEGQNVLWGPQLQRAVQGSQVQASRLDDMATRVLAAWYYLGQDKGYPGINIKANVQGNHKDNVRAVARDGIVLLKNSNKALPLAKPKRIAVIGSSTVVNSGGRNACVDHGCNGAVPVLYRAAGRHPRQGAAGGRAGDGELERQRAAGRAGGPRGRRGHRLHHGQLGRGLHRGRGQQRRPQGPGPLAQRQPARPGRRPGQQEHHRRRPQHRAHPPREHPLADGRAGHRLGRPAVVGERQRHHRHPLGQHQPQRQAALHHRQVPGRLRHHHLDGQRRLPRGSVH
jgi:beta-glucosidase-like glycosyl hydrolase